MYTYFIFAHSVLRWVILLLLLINIVMLFSGKNKKRLSLLLLLSAHLTLVIGVAQYFFGSRGIELIKTVGVSSVMENSIYRFWTVEHSGGMIIAIALITIGHILLKRSGKTKRTAIIYLIALAMIIALIPWPNREGVGRPLVPSLKNNKTKTIDM